MLYSLTNISMLTAKQSSDMLKTMSEEERFQAIQHKVSEKTKAAIDQKIRETVAAYEKRIEIVLRSDVCTDPDKDISALLKALGYEDIKVTSDFPGYSESYTGTTTIKFTIPF